MNHRLALTWLCAYVFLEKLVEPSTRRVVSVQAVPPVPCAEALDVTRRGKEMLCSLLPGKIKWDWKAGETRGKLLFCLRETLIRNIQLVKYQIVSEHPPPPPIEVYYEAGCSLWN